MEKGWTLVKPEEASGDSHLPVNMVDFLSGNGHRLKEIDSPSQDQSSITNLNLNIGLHLLSKSDHDHSMVEDGVVQSHAHAHAHAHGQHNNKPHIQVEVLKEELVLMVEENKRLKEKLSEANKTYKTLESDFLILFEQQKENHNLQVVSYEEQKMEANNNGDHRSRDEIPLEERKNKREMSTDRGEQGWVPSTSKIAKLGPSTKSSSMDQPQGAAVEAMMRKARVSVRARNEGAMMSDGCQWRKYGQKMAKGNPCPRSYYRCTMAVGCPVRKQVQRCAEDKSVLITTYEGNHNHPLPPAALQMASATSAAATMLLSGSAPTADINTLMNPNFLATTFMPFSSNVATISASAPFPTVTLDLTTPLQMPDPSSQPALFGRPIGPQHLSQLLNNTQSTFSGLHTSHAGLDRDTMSAATAAITTDPNFPAAMAAVFSAMFGAGQEGSGASNISGGSK